MAGQGTYFGVVQKVTFLGNTDKVLRDEAIRKACMEWGYTMATTARAAGIHYSTVSKIIKGER